MGKKKQKKKNKNKKAKKNKIYTPKKFKDETKEDKNNIIYPIEENEIGDFEKSFLDNY